MSTAKGKSKSKSKANSGSKGAVDESEEISQLRSQLENERAISASYRGMIESQKKLLNEQRRTIIDDQRVTIFTTRKELTAAEEQLKRLAALKQSASPFLKKLPVEIRIKIYKLLLVNPELGESSSIGKDVAFGDNKKFELSPAILRTCRTINAEADPILYGCNTFVMECIGAHGPRGNHVPQSPLTRHECSFRCKCCAYTLGNEHDFDFTDMKGFKKVKHWKIITTSYRPMISDPAPARLFVHFCQALCRLSSQLEQLQRSIEVVVALAKAPSRSTHQALAPGVTDPAVQFDFSEKQMGYLIQPLKLLKEIGIEHISLRLAKKEDMPTPPDHLCMKPSYYFPDIVPEIDANTNPALEDFNFELLADNVVEKYEDMVLAGSPVEKVYEMHERLMTYALIFEICLEFKSDMKTLHRNHGTEPEIRHFGWHLPKPSHGNPFRSYAPIHPVERALSGEPNFLLLHQPVLGVSTFLRSQYRVLDC